MAAYASIWISVYVIAFPLFILRTLWSYHVETLSIVQQGTGSKGYSVNPRSTSGVDLRFLRNDFKPLAPMFMWEGVEMIRKLLLSVVGSFWTTKSTMCIAVALLISLFYTAVHLTYQPYRCPSVNRLQTLALTALSLLYFAALLLKTESLDAEDRSNISSLMIVLISLVLVACVSAIGLEVRSAKLWLKQTRMRMHAFTLMFRGNVQPTKGVPCICSFPGKYEDEWHAVVESSSSLSVACVFLPQHTPDFGKHAIDREASSGGRCYCYSIYGMHTCMSISSCLERG
jgi:hypothetical protein